MKSTHGSPMEWKERLLQPGVLAAFGAALLFGAGTPVAKLLLRTVDPWLLAGLLYLGSGLGLTLYRRLVRAPAVRLAKSEIWWLAGAIAAGGVVGPVLLMLGLTRTPASGASLLLNAEGVFTALLAWFAFKENFDWRIALGMAVHPCGRSDPELARRNPLHCIVAGVVDTGRMSGVGRRQQSDAKGVADRRNLDCLHQGARCGSGQSDVGDRAGC